MNSVDSRDRKQYRFSDREHKDFFHEFVVDIEILLPYFTKNPDLSPFIPFIPEVAGNPYEIWQVFQENSITGQTRLRSNFIKASQLKEEPHGFVLIFEALEGEFKSVEFIVFKGEGWSDRMNQYRSGKLIYARDA